MPTSAATSSPPPVSFQVLPVSIIALYYIVYYGFGILYISNGNNITKLTTAEVSLDFTPTSTLNGPRGLAQDSLGFLYVDDGTNRIVKMSSNGSAVAIFTTSPALNVPSGVAINPSNQHIWISDTYNQRIVELAPNGTQLSTFTTANPGFAYPEAVAFDSQGGMYVADEWNNRIVKRFSNGTVVDFYTALYDVYDVVVDAADNVYIADKGNNRVLQVSPVGTLLQIFTTTSPALSSPTGLALDGEGNLYVCDYLNNRVVRFSSVAVPTQHLPSSSSSVYTAPIASTAATSATASLSSSPSSVSASSSPSSGSSLSRAQSPVFSSSTGFSSSIGSLPVPVYELQSISPAFYALGRTTSTNLTGKSLEQVAFILVGLNNVGSEQATSSDISLLASLPLVNASALQDSELAAQQWAEQHNYTFAYSILRAPLLPMDAAALTFTLPALNDSGYHTLLVLSSTAPPLNLTDWVYTANTSCTTLLSVDGQCSTSCPDGCFCTGDGRCWPEPGWWSSGEHVAPTSCVLPSSCPGALEVGPSEQSPDRVLLLDGSRNTERCAADYTGTVCSSCAVNYYHAGAACRYCGDNESEQVGALVGLLIAAAIIGAAVVALVTLSSPFRLASRVALLLALQQVILIGQTATPLLPFNQAWLAEVFTDVSMINLDVTMFHPGCAIPALSFVEVFWATFVIAIGEAVLLCGGAGLRAWLIQQHVRGDGAGFLWKAWHVPGGGAPTGLSHLAELAEKKDTSDEMGSPAHIESPRERRRSLHCSVMEFIDQWPLSIRADLAEGFGLSSSSTLRWWFMTRARLQQALMVGASIGYLRLTTLILEVLHCGKVENMDGTGTQLVLMVDRTTLCYQGSHLPTAVVAWMMLFGYSIGFPVLLCYLLWRVHAPASVNESLSAMQMHHARAQPQPHPSSPHHSTADDSTVSVERQEGALQEASLTSTHSTTTTCDAATADRVDHGGPSEPRDKADPFHAVVQARVDYLSPRHLAACEMNRTVKPEAARRVETAYLAQCLEQVVLHRFARYGYLLSGLRSDSVYFYALVPLVVNFGLACLVVLPDQIYVRVFVSSFTFVLRCFLVAVLWPFSPWTGNAISMASNIGLVLQSLVALGIIQGLAVTHVSADPNAAAALTLQQRLETTAVDFLSGNVVYLAVLAGVVLLLLSTASLSCLFRRHKEKEEKVQQSGYRSHQSSRDKGEDGETALNSTATSTPRMPSKSGDIEMVHPIRSAEPSALPDRVDEKSATAQQGSEQPQLRRGFSSYELSHPEPLAHRPPALPLRPRPNPQPMLDPYVSLAASIPVETGRDFLPHPPPRLSLPPPLPPPIPPRSSATTTISSTIAMDESARAP